MLNRTYIMLYIVIMVYTCILVWRKMNMEYITTLVPMLELHYMAYEE